MKNKFISTLSLLICIINIFGQNPLFIPDTINNSNISLSLQSGTIQFYSGNPTNTLGVNGDILGPTIIMNNGDFYDIQVDNQLSDTTTIHWHGMHVSAENDGGPHTIIAPNDAWNPKFTVLDKAATYWYHPHLHEHTNEHVSKGMAGMIIVRDNEEQALNLPRKYGVDDFPIIIQTKDFDSLNQIVVPSNTDDVLMVNGTLDPVLDAPAQVVRFRVLNGASMRVFNLGLTGNQTFYQIASDGGLLESSVPLTRLRLAPGERAELLIDLNGMSGQSISLLSYASELPNGIYGAQYPGTSTGLAMNGYNPNPMNGQDFNVITFNIQNQTVSPVTTIPSNLVSVVPWDETQTNLTRNLTFRSVNPGPNQLNEEFVINDQPFLMDSINYIIPLDHTEIWSIINHSPIAHPFHIHDVQFYILDRNGVAPALNEQGRKDVVLIERMETVRFIMKFEDFANDSIPYMYHCHMLNHEDGGMMGQFVVVDPPQSIEETASRDDIRMFPNPSSGRVSVKSISQPIEQLEIYDLSGRQIWSKKLFSKELSLDLPLKCGTYVLKTKVGDAFQHQKIIIDHD